MCERQRAAKAGTWENSLRFSSQSVRAVSVKEAEMSEMASIERERDAPIAATQDTTAAATGLRSIEGMRRKLCAMAFGRACKSAA